MVIVVFVTVVIIVVVSLGFDVVILRCLDRRFEFFVFVGLS